MVSRSSTLRGGRPRCICGHTTGLLRAHNGGEFLQEHEAALASKLRLEEDLVRLVSAGGEQSLSVNVGMVALALGKVASEPDHVGRLWRTISEP